VQSTHGRGADAADTDLAKLEPEQDFIVENDVARLLEAVALVKRDRAAVALTGARAQDLDTGSTAEVLDDQVECRGADAQSLVALVNEELPEVLRYVIGAAPREGRTRPCRPAVLEPARSSFRLGGGFGQVRERRDRERLGLWRALLDE